MKKTLTHLLSATILILPVIVSAQVGLKNPLSGVDSISDLILIVTRVVRYIAIPFIVLAIMYAGFLFIWNEAFPKAASNKNAKDVLWYTVIGAFVLLSAELIALVMRNTINSATN